MISIKTHNTLDYVLGVLLILTPNLFGFGDLAFARDVFFVVGFTLIGYSLLTDYAYSFAKIIPLRMHRTFDIVSGIFVMLAPFVYGYREELTGFQIALHYVYGIGAILFAAFTPKAKKAEKQPERYGGETWPYSNKDASRSSQRTESKKAS